jgi:hypothetical protein
MDISSTAWLRIGGTLAFGIGTASLCMGFVNSFLIPVLPGDSYFCCGRVWLGNLPFVAAFPLLSLAGWLFFRSASKQRHLSVVVTYCVGGAMGIILLLFVAGGIYQSLKGY